VKVKARDRMTVLKMGATQAAVAEPAAAVSEGEKKA
jgi:hypothetical protein